jgi:hypothetical protein
MTVVATAVGGVRTRGVDSPRVTAILAALDDEPGLTVGELAARTGRGTRLLHAVLWRLEDERRVIHEGNRWYVRRPAA